MTTPGNERHDDERNDDDPAAAMDRSRARAGRLDDPSPTPDTFGPMEEFIEPASSSVDPPLPPSPEDREAECTDLGQRGEA